MLGRWRSGNVNGGRSMLLPANKLAHLLRCRRCPFNTRTTQPGNGTICPGNALANNKTTGSTSYATRRNCSNCPPTTPAPPNNRDRAICVHSPCPRNCIMPCSRWRASTTARCLWCYSVRLTFCSTASVVRPTCVSACRWPTDGILRRKT